MERFLREYDRECMKLAILKHEETFRQQVHELHRLYRVQKLLMRDMNNQLKKQRILRCAQANLGNHENAVSSNLPRNSPRHQRSPRRALNLDLPADEYIERGGEDRVLEIGDEIGTELTLTTGSNCWKREAASFASDSGTGFSSASTELWLTGHEWTLQQEEDVEVSYQNGINKSRFEFEEGMRKERLKQPPWIFQCLSLKIA